MVTRWFQSHFQVSQNVTQFLFHLKCFLILAAPRNLGETSLKADKILYVNDGNRHWLKKRGTGEPLVWWCGSDVRRAWVCGSVCLHFGLMWKCFPMSVSHKSIHEKTCGYTTRNEDHRGLNNKNKQHFNLFLSRQRTMCIFLLPFRGHQIQTLTSRHPKSRPAGPQRSCLFYA